MNTILEHRTWRYATKKFDAKQKIAEKDLQILLNSMRLTASSYGLQPYHIMVITDPEIRKKLQPVSWGQTQIVDASHLIVLANKTEVDADWIDTYLTNVSETRNIPLEALNGYADFMKSKILVLSPEEQAEWASKQNYLVLGNLLSAAAELKIDTCPMEGFEAEAYNEILGLSEKGLNATVVTAIGYRSSEDETQHYAKVRQPESELFTHI